jgi:hypothetical protein
MHRHLMSTSAVVGDVVETRGQKPASWRIVQSQSTEVEVAVTAILQGAALVCRHFDWNVSEVNARASRSPVRDPGLYLFSVPWDSGNTVPTSARPRCMWSDTTRAAA